MGEKDAGADERNDGQMDGLIHACLSEWQAGRKAGRHDLSGHVIRQRDNGTV